MRIVFDTNVILSALFFNGSTPYRAFDFALEHGVVLFSTATLEELTQVLSRDKFRPYISKEEAARFLNAFINTALPIETNVSIHACRDPKDNKFLELGISGEADFIITGDNDLLLMNPFQNIIIITPAAFLQQYTE